MRRLVLAVTAAALTLGIVAGPVAARTAKPGSIVDIAVAASQANPGEFKTLVAAVLAADPAVLETLSKQRQLTVFAPTDAAFAKLGLDADSIGGLPQGTLTQILLYHVAPGARDAADVTSSDRIRTLEGGALDVTVNADGAFVDDARIVAVDIKASNGIIHVIDTVLMP